MSGAEGREELCGGRDGGRDQGGKEMGREKVKKGDCGGRGSGVGSIGKDGRLSRSIILKPQTLLPKRCCVLAAELVGVKTMDRDVL